MSLINLILQNLFSFVFIISFIVFIHEFGHFIIARICGVKVEIFSIGFGKEIFGFQDKKGTRWRFSILPLGGYVKMFGDENIASKPDFSIIEKMGEEEKKQSFIFKNVYQRIAIVIAGPLANIIFTILLLTILLKINGINSTLPIIDKVIPSSPAFEAGLKSGDQIIKINNQEINDFKEIFKIVSTNLDEDLYFQIKRGDEIIEKQIKPTIQESTNIFKENIKTKMIGITSSKFSNKRFGIFQSFIEAAKETFSMSLDAINATKQLILGERSIKELSGPIKIAKYSGETVKMGFSAIIWFMAIISLNLGIMNLFPIPMLDGGHLFFYTIEAILKKPLSAKTQQIAFSVGMSLLFSLMIFTIINDLLSF